MGARDIVARSSPQPEQKELPLGIVESLFPRRSSIAEFYISKIRELLQTPVHRNAAAHLWDVQFWPRDRKFLLQLARLNVELHARTWYQLDTSEQARLLAAFVKVRDWVDRFRTLIEQ